MFSRESRPQNVVLPTDAIPGRVVTLLSFDASSVTLANEALASIAFLGALDWNSNSTGAVAMVSLTVNVSGGTLTFMFPCVVRKFK
jgi:hypothetical protein